jgi:hypothetical protein
MSKRTLIRSTPAGQWVEEFAGPRDTLSAIPASG